MTTTPPPDLGPLELARWAWRQLTSMRTALLLLFLLALAAVPGSVVPQENVDSLKVSQWKDQHRTLTPIYEKLQLFTVYHSVWFSAIYLLLVVSLVGCIVPRLGVYWRGLRKQPPPPPRNLARMPAYLRGSVPEESEGRLERAAAELKRRRYRVVRGDGWVSAEKGYLREAGNLLFHMSVLVVLAGLAISNLFGFEGGVIVVTGHGFSNSLSQYDEFKPGGLFTGNLSPFSFTVKDFNVNFITEGREQGMAHEFSADLDVTTPSGKSSKSVAVNHPLDLNGTEVFLISHGYAPSITVRDGSGNVAYSGPVVFLPEDQSFKSFGVLKVPDARDSNGNAEQLGLEGEFYPTYVFTMETGPFSAFPDAKNPALSMLAYAGDLGLDNGKPQSVYALNKAGLKPITDAGKPVRIDLMQGQSRALPEGRGTVTFDGVARYVKLQVSRAPMQWLALLGMCLALTGLLGSLFIRPRRIWVRANDDVVELAALDRTAGGDPQQEITKLASTIGVEEKVQD